MIVSDGKLGGPCGIRQYAADRVRELPPDSTFKIQHTRLLLPLTHDFTKRNIPASGTFS